MRLLIVSHLFKNPLEHSKLPHLADLLQRLSEDVEIHVIAPVPWFPPIRWPRRWRVYGQIPRKYRYDAVSVRYPRHLVPPARLLYAAAGRTFLRALRGAVASETYDVIWAHYAFPDGWAAVKLGKERNTPVIVTVRGEDVRSDVRHWGVRKRVVWALQEADVVTSPHPETTELAKALGRNEVVELHNSLDVRRFSRGDGARVRSELSLSDEFVVTFVGHLVEFKDPETFVRAAAKIPQKEAIAFLVVGSAGRGREQTDLRSLATRMGVADRVKFLGDRGDIPDILAASDLFVALSPYENIWSNTLLEAMAAGVPSIVTRAGSTERFLRHGKETWLVAPKSPPDLAQAILHLRSTPAVRRELSQRGKSLVVAEFDIGGVKDRVLTLSRSLTRRSASA